MVAFIRGNIFVFGQKFVLPLFFLQASFLPISHTDSASAD